MCDHLTEIISNQNNSMAEKWPKSTPFPALCDDNYLYTQPNRTVMSHLYDDKRVSKVRLGNTVQFHLASSPGVWGNMNNPLMTSHRCRLRSRKLTVTPCWNKMRYAFMWFLYFMFWTHKPFFFFTNTPFIDYIIWNFFITFSVFWVGTPPFWSRQGGLIFLYPFLCVLSIYSKI